MEHRLRTPEGAAAYAKRSHTIEPVFADRKHNHAMRSFRRRGLPAANSEWAFMHLAANLLKLRQHRDRRRHRLTGPPTRTHPPTPAAPRPKPRTPTPTPDRPRRAPPPSVSRQPAWSERLFLTPFVRSADVIEYDRSDVDARETTTIAPRDFRRP